MKFNIDLRFKEYFKNLKQVFFYLIDECNLKCHYCLCKPDLIFPLKQKEIPLENLIALTSVFKEMGASKLTIIGGEPTLYGVSQNWKPLLDLITTAKDLGYEYIRIDTNGVFNSSLLEKKELKKLDEITFSLDSHEPKINDSLRGNGVFNKCISNIKLAKKLGYNVDITCCVHKANIGFDKDGELLLYKMILYAESLGVNKINFHPIFKMGIPRDTWIGNVDIKPNEWLEVYNKIQEKIKDEYLEIKVRIPQRFITKEEFNKEPEYYGYCPVKLGERVLIHTNGIIRICALMISTPYGIGKFYDNKIELDKTFTNETRNHKLKEITPCANQRGDFEGLVPLCISFKPKQEEIIWKKKLKWESKRKQVECNKYEFK